MEELDVSNTQQSHLIFFLAHSINWQTLHVIVPKAGAVVTQHASDRVGRKKCPIKLTCLPALLIRVHC